MSTSEDSSHTLFRSPLRAGITLILILIGLGQISGRVFSINSLNMLAVEASLRTELQEELKFLVVQAAEAGNAEDQAVYSTALKEEFQFDAAKLLETEEARLAVKERAKKRGPIQARRENWDVRREPTSIEKLIEKVDSETKFRREDLLAELKYRAVKAHEVGKSDDRDAYLSAIPGVIESIQATSLPEGGGSSSLSDLNETQLEDPAIVDAIKDAKTNAKHHWPIELRERDSQRIRDRYSTQAIVDIVRAEVNKQRPFLSGNDRSRWLSVRSLVEFGTFEVNEILEYEPSWDSVDIVSHKNAQGLQKLYSSKPPLQSVIVAVPYWILEKITGWNFKKHPFEVGRILLLFTCVIPIGFGWYCCARILDDWCDDDLSYITLVASICFATMLTTFGVAFNNHLWGAVSASAASMYAIRCWKGSTSVLDFVATGFWSALTFTSELPAASLVALFGFLMLLRAPRLTLVAGTPTVLLVLLAYFGTNYIAHGKWSPPYSFGAGDVNTADSIQRENWYDYDFVRYFDGRKIDSYWRSPNNPLDLGEPKLDKYVFHSTIGHHGIFSLTPLFFLTIPGLALTCLSKRLDQRYWGIAISIVSIACVVFYLFLLDVRQRNYGGNTSSFRQLMWLHPLWMIAAAPVVERLMRRRWGVLLVGILISLSMISVSYPDWNPWTQNWIWNWMLWTGARPLSR